MIFSGFCKKIFFKLIVQIGNGGRHLDDLFFDVNSGDNACHYKV